MIENEKYETTTKLLAVRKKLEKYKKCLTKNQP